MLAEMAEKMGVTQAELDKMPVVDEPEPDTPLFEKAFKMANDAASWIRSTILPIADTEKLKKPIVVEVLDIISYYNFHIPAMIYRSECGKTRNESDVILPNTNGLAKIALVSLDKSLAGWSVLMEELSDYQDEILITLLNLAEIRKLIEQTFHLARKLVRPGFDEEMMRSGA